MTFLLFWAGPFLPYIFKNKNCRRSHSTLQTTFDSCTSKKDLAKRRPPATRFIESSVELRYSEKKNSPIDSAIQLSAMVNNIFLNVMYVQYGFYISY